MKNLLVIGTSHISTDSINEIKEKIISFKPEIVAVELDKKRYYLLNKKKINDNISFMNIFNVGLSGYLFLIIGKYLQKKLGSIVGVEPGSDMKKAVELCKKNNLNLALIDQDIDITLKNFSKKFSFKEKIKLLIDILIAPFSKEQINFDISKVPEDKLIADIILKLKKRYPNIYYVLIEERNKFMAKKIFQLIKNNPDKKILCVIGAGHKKGFFDELKNIYYSNPTIF